MNVLKKILIVEDDQLLNRTLAYNLTSDGYEVISVFNFDSAVRKLRENEFDVALLDINLPDGSGLDLCEEIRNRGQHTYIIFITANDKESDMLKGYEVGGADYVTKPFSVTVLCKKVAAVFANLELRTPRHDLFDDGFLKIDFSEQSASLAGESLDFTPKEYRTLFLFVKNPRIILTKRQILEKLWDIDGDFVDEHILFYNLVRQKGNQYTLSLFVSSLLIALTVFSICFNGSSFLELHYQVKEDPYDYAVLTTGEQQKDLDESTIRLMAEEHNISTSDWHSLDMLLIGREHQYQEKEKNEWGPEFVISQSSFEDLTGQTLSLPENGFGYFEDSDNATFQTFSNEQGNFYNPSVHKEFHLTKTSLISEENIVNNSTQISYFLILNDKTFQELKNSLGPDYQFRYYLFNGDHPENSKAFQDELLGKIVTLNNGEIFDSYQEAAVQDKISGYSDVIIPYAGNELYAARQWDFYPYAKATQLDILLESGSVYLLLIFFIAIIAFVSASMIMCLKIAGTILQDQESYQRAVYLGLKERDLKKMIRKQIALIYFFPTFCGSITAIFMINRFMAVSSVTHISAITVLAVLLSVVVVIIQIIAFGVLQRRMTAVATKAVYEKNY